MGLPAIATALIGSSAKNSYNDDSPAVDGTRKYVNEITATLTALAHGPAGRLPEAQPDDLRAAGRLKRETPGREAEAFAYRSGVEGVAQAAAAWVFTSDLLSMAMAASRSMRSMAATSRAMRSSADSYSWRSE